MSVLLHIKGSKLKYHSGFSLIELLITMLIGLFLLVGISSSYVSSKKTSVARDQYSILEDNGRVALEVMANTIQHTGYASSGVLDNKFITGAVTSDNCSGGGQSVINTTIFPANSTLDNVLGDSIGVAYVGDSSVTTDCTGGTIHPNCQTDSGSVSSSIGSSKIYSSFYLDNASVELKCAGSRRNDEETIADGIENMQILYGVDADTPSDGVVDRYVNATNLGGWGDNVLSVQIAVLVRSQREIKSNDESLTFTLLDTPHTTPSDRYMRAVFSTTINLRNRL